MTQPNDNTVIITKEDEKQLIAQTEHERLIYMEGHMAAMIVSSHRRNIRWWQDVHTTQLIKRNVGELLMLIVSEISEGMEGHRKNLMDDKLPHRPMLEVELADAIERIFDLAGGLNLDVAGAWREKCEYNMIRKDHTHEARKAKGGKAY